MTSDFAADLHRPLSPARRGGPSILDPLLQAGHRLATVSLLALLGTLACAYLGRDFYWPLAVAAAAAMVGASAALLVLSTSPRIGLVIVTAATAFAAVVVLLILEYPGTAVATGSAGLLAVALELWTAESQSHPRVRREAVGLLVFNGSVGVSAVALMLVARASVIQDQIRQDGGEVRAGIRAFFTPPPVLPPQ